jgi:surfactin synthase thioesterase subunit
MTPGRWLLPWHPRPDDHPMLVCIPPAGAGCGQYGRWQTALGSAISVVGVQLPGRERRWAEPAASTVEDAVRATASELDALLPAGRPLVVFGHSFGGLLGYEVVRRLGSYGRWPTALVVAACRPPNRWVGAGHGLVEDDEELSGLFDLRGLGDLDEDSRALMLDLLRSDARLSLTYTDPEGAGVACPVEAWGGTEDRVVLASDLDGWARYGDGGFARRQFPGGHYFTHQSDALVLAALRTLLATAAPLRPSITGG